MSCVLGLKTIGKAMLSKTAERIPRTTNTIERSKAHNWDGKKIKFGHEENQVLFRHIVERHPEFENHLMIVVQCLEMIDPFHDTNSEIILDTIRRRCSDLPRN